METVKRFILLIILFGLTRPALALGPHEILLIVNRNSPASLEIANNYAALRNIPSENIVYVELPASALAPAATIKPEEFSEYIWLPVSEICDERRLTEHIRAWVYSVDFPSRIAARPSVSLTGITFVRNKLPPPDQIEAGSYRSPLFAGPDRPGASVRLSMSLETATTESAGAVASVLPPPKKIKEPLSQIKPPLPSMLLGWAGARGMTTEEIITQLQTAARADGSQPRGQFLFVDNADIRSTCRRWQYQSAVNILTLLGANAAVVSNRIGRTKEPLIGLMTGARQINPKDYGRLLPGSMAEHLTSLAADFAEGHHTLLTQWLLAGAAASCGTVSEPRAIWTKFPSAFFHVHYYRGLTMLESFALAVACPLQLLLVGDPLVCPWKPNAKLLLNGPGLEPTESRISYRPSLIPAPDRDETCHYVYYLDGRLAGASRADRPWELDTTTVADGYHKVRAVAYIGDSIQRQYYAEKGLIVNNHGRAAMFIGLTNDLDCDLHHPIYLAVSATSEPQEIGLVSGCRILARAAGSNQIFRFDPTTLGAGLITLQAWAQYPDGMFVRSEPWRFMVKDLNRPPAIRVSQQGTNNGTMFTAQAEDPENDTVTFSWFYPLWLHPNSLHGAADKTEVNGDITLTPLPGTPYSFVLFTNLPAAVTEFKTTISFPRLPPAGPHEERACLLFDYDHPGHFSYCGFDGDKCAWTLGHCENGKNLDKVGRGLPIRRERAYELAIRCSPAGIYVYLDNELIFADEERHQPHLGQIGLLIGRTPIRFRHSTAKFRGEHPDFRVTNNQLWCSTNFPTWIIQATDGISTSEKLVTGE